MVRADATNPFNLVRWSNPTTSITSSNFGKVTGASGGRDHSAQRHGGVLTRMNRREFAKGLGAALAAAQPQTQAAAQTPDGGTTPTLYYVDGYHGGSRGHMPAGSWRDILNAMRTIPEWKISLDIEPASWDDLRREDPQAYREFRNLLDDLP